MIVVLTIDQSINMVLYNQLTQAQKDEFNRKNPNYWKDVPNHPDAPKNQPNYHTKAQSHTPPVAPAVQSSPQSRLVSPAQSDAKKKAEMEAKNAEAQKKAALQKRLREIAENRLRTANKEPQRRRYDDDDDEIEERQPRRRSNIEFSNPTVYLRVQRRVCTPAIHVNQFTGQVTPGYVCQQQHQVYLIHQPQVYSNYCPIRLGH